MRFGEEIAVLDGFEAIPGYYKQGQVIDASAGANYSGGSSWPGDLPLTPSNAGLADTDLVNYYTKTGVLDASAGANYSGGSNWPGNLPLTPSNSGLAGLAAAVQNADQTGEGNMAVSTLMFQQLINLLGGGIKEDGVWGKASSEGLVRAVVSSGGDEEKDIRNALQNIRAVSKGRLLIMPTQYVGGMIKQITKKMASGAAVAMNGLSDADLVNYYTKTGIIDASAGANYSGGSSWPGSLPLTPSNAGLAEAGVMYNGRPVTSMDTDYGSTMGSLENENIPGYYNRGQVIDASAGANYSGGSSWPGNLPLTPSNAGLAELMNVDPMDGLFDNIFKKRLFANQYPAFARIAARNKLMGLKRAGLLARQRGMTAEANRIGNMLRSMRMMRRNILTPTRAAA